MLDMSETQIVGFLMQRLNRFRADEKGQFHICDLSRRMGKPTICIGENKGADQLRGNREADQCLCFCYTDSTIPLLSKSKISSL